MMTAGNNIQAEVYLIDALGTSKKSTSLIDDFAWKYVVTRSNVIGAPGKYIWEVFDRAKCGTFMGALKLPARPERIFAGKPEGKDQAIMYAIMMVGGGQ